MAFAAIHPISDSDSLLRAVGMNVKAAAIFVRATDVCWQQIHNISEKSDRSRRESDGKFPRLVMHVKSTMSIAVKNSTDVVFRIWNVLRTPYCLGLVRMKTEDSQVTNHRATVQTEGRCRVAGRTTHAIFHFCRDAVAHLIKEPRFLLINPRTVSSFNVTVGRYQPQNVGHVRRPCREKPLVKSMNARGWIVSASPYGYTMAPTIRNHRPGGYAEFFGNDCRRFARSILLRNSDSVRPSYCAARGAYFDASLTKSVYDCLVAQSKIQPDGQRCFAVDVADNYF